MMMWPRIALEIKELKTITHLLTSSACSVLHWSTWKKQTKHCIFKYKQATWNLASVSLPLCRQTLISNVPRSIFFVARYLFEGLLNCVPSSTNLLACSLQYVGHWGLICKDANCRGISHKADSLGHLLQQHLSLHSIRGRWGRPQDLRGRSAMAKLDAMHTKHVLP